MLYQHERQVKHEEDFIASYKLTELIDGLNAVDVRNKWFEFTWINRHKFLTLRGTQR